VPTSLEGLSARPWTRIQVYNWCPVSVLSISSRPSDSDPISIGPVPRHTSTLTADTITSSRSARSSFRFQRLITSCHFALCDSGEFLVLTVRPVRWATEWIAVRYQHLSGAWRSCAICPSRLWQMAQNYCCRIRVHRNRTDRHWQTELSVLLHTFWCAIVCHCPYK